MGERRGRGEEEAEGEVGKDRVGRRKGERDGEEAGGRREGGRAGGQGGRKASDAIATLHIPHQLCSILHDRANRKQTDRGREGAKQPKHTQKPTHTEEEQQRQKLGTLVELLDFVQQGGA